MLREQAEDIEVPACRHGINDNTGVMKKFKNQIKELVPSIDFWRLYVLTDIIGQGNRSKESADRAMLSLLPAVYRYNRMKKTENPTLRKEYEKAWKKALIAFHAHALTGTFGEDEIVFRQNRARETVGKFHRASSAVEGRNGFLSQIYHNKRGLVQNVSKRLPLCIIIS